MPESIARRLFAENDDVREYKTLITVEDLIKFEESLTPTLGGSLSANSGNTAYVSSDGNNGTGEVGNISKPFLTADAAIAALNAASDGTLIILSATSTIEITDYDYTTMPYDLSIQVLCDQVLRIGGSSSFGNLGIQTNGEVIINTQLIFATDGSMRVNCKTFTVPNTANGNISYSGSINCDRLVIATNANIEVNADVLIWNQTASVGTIIGFTYNICPPKVWSAKLSQVDTDAPTVGAVFVNTFGETMTTARVDLGEYNVGSPGSSFLTSKTRVMLGGFNADLAGQAGVIQKGTGSNSTVNIHSYDAFLGAADNIMQELDLTIETYL